MATVTSASARVTRSFRRELPPVKPSRVAPTPATPFGLGLDGFTVIAEYPVKHDATQAVAITEAEDCGFRYTVRSFRDGVEVATLGFDSLGDAKAMAWHLSEPMPVEVEPEVKSEPSPAAVRKPATKPINRPSRPMRATRHTADDERWWMANSPTCRVGFYVEGSVDPYDTENLTLSAFDYHVNEMVLAPSLSDDYTDALATGCREGGDR